MKLIELPNSPYWGANIHVGYYPGGKKRYSIKSSKVRRDPTMLNAHGGREDKILALRVLTKLQDLANQAMEIKKEHDIVHVAERGRMLDELLRSCGLRVVGSAPAWDTYSLEVLERHCRDVAPATRRSYFSKKSAFEKWLATHPRLSPGSSLADFKLADIQEFYDYWIAAGGASTTVNAAIEGISMVFARAVVEDFIPKNPCEGVKKLDSVSVPKQPFTLEDLGKITRAVLEHRDDIEHADEWALAIRFATFTGARLSDCIKLRWSDFSDEFRRVRFVPKKKEGLHAKGKVDASVTLILPEFVGATLAAAAASSSSEWVTPALRTIETGKRGLGPRFREILDYAGVVYEIREGKGAKGIAQCSHGFHSFRHTLKTELRAGGVSAATNDYVTGHDDPKVAARYIHEKAETIARECAPVFDAIRKAIGS